VYELGFERRRAGGLAGPLAAAAEEGAEGHRSRASAAAAEVEAGGSP